MKLKLCNYAGCSALCPGYYCAKHQAMADKCKAEQGGLFKGTIRQKSKPYHSLYESVRWRKMRKEFLQLHPYCVQCGAKATIADHITPHHGSEDLFYNMNNLQAMCWSCHSAKTLKENGYFRKKKPDR